MGKLEKVMAPHSSTLAWKIPWTEEPGRLQSMGLLRVRHDWATTLSVFTFHFHALEKEMATHSNILAWRIPGTGEPGGLPSMRSHRVGHDWSVSAAAAAAADGETMETMKDFIYLFIFWVSKIPADGDSYHEIKRYLLPGRKAMTNLLLLLSHFSRVRLCATP